MSKEYDLLIRSTFLPDSKIIETHPVGIGNLQRRNNARDAKKLQKWSIAEISQALSGEVGELQNKLKKKYTQKELITMGEIEEELADVQIYLVLLASKLKVDLAMATARKYNQKLSKK